MASSLDLIMIVDLPTPVDPKAVSYPARIYNRVDAEIVLNGIQLTSGLKSIGIKFGVVRSLYPECVDLIIEAAFPDRDTGVLGAIGGRMPIIVPTYTQDFVRTVRDALARLLIHELDEGFMLGNNRVFDPHDPIKEIKKTIISK